MAARMLYQADDLEVLLDKAHGWLYANWKGRHHDASIKEGITRMIDLMVEHQVFNILNDNTNMSGIWIGVAGWLVRDALPRARQAGLHSFAHVFGSNGFPRVSAEAALLLLGPGASDIKTFENIEAAKSWLRSR